MHEVLEVAGRNYLYQLHHDVIVHDCTLNCCWTFFDIQVETNVAECYRTITALIVDSFQERVGESVKQR